MIDGGLPLIAKGRISIKDYLEDIVPNLAEDKILAFNVVPIQRTGDTSRIKAGNAVFVIEVPDSDRAPHQSTRDLKYYVRLGSKSQPASHRIIEDIRNRARHPKLELDSIRIGSAQYPAAYRSLELTLEITIRNSSRIRASNVCLALSASSGLGFRWVDQEQAVMRSAGRSDTALIELSHTVYPEMELVLRSTVYLNALFHPAMRKVSQGGKDCATLTVGEEPWEHARIWTTLYADSAPAQKKEWNLDQIDPKQEIEKFLRSNS
jgi:hypothetical protein